MPTTSHIKAAEAHEAAAKSHHIAAADHKKGDHKLGLEHSDNAVKLTEAAQACCTDAHAKSKSAAH